jgi:AcrR family transcriptional regulator
MAVATPSFIEAPPLPRGPHRLSREEVRASQRNRLLAAVTTLVAERGYEAATIGEVARRAGVSPNVFYEHFASKADCFLAAYDAFVAALLDRLVAVDPDAPWHEFVTRTLGAYLEFLDSEPDVARAFLVEIDGSGPEGRRRRRDAYRAFAHLLSERHQALRRSDPALGELPGRAYLGLIYGIREIVRDAIEDGSPRKLASLRPDLLRWIAAALEGA